MTHSPSRPCGITCLGLHGRAWRFTGPRGRAVELRREPSGAYVLSLRPLGRPRGYVLRQTGAAALALSERFARRYC